MRYIKLLLLSGALFLQQAALANPYWDQTKVPKDSSYASSKTLLPDYRHLKTVDAYEGAQPVLRMQIDWIPESDTFSFAGMAVEGSGTQALLARSQTKPKWGSYLGVLRNNDGTTIYYDSIGTGQEYRKLTRAITFRFPIPHEDSTFELFAENPQTGVMEKVFSKYISAKLIPREAEDFDGVVEVKELALATKTPTVRVNIYSEGYKDNAADKSKFWESALKTVRTLKGEKFPGVEHMNFYGVFHGSNKELGKARDLGLPVEPRDSYLGLYYPYWDNFGRWYNVVYPTSEDRMRTGIGAVPYDYPIILVNSSEYWGVGNYMAFTAIPANSPGYFNYLLMHEFGHFFGLNEEYEGGGRTELEFASQIDEPWSQNITFLADPRHDKLKWNRFVSKNRTLPTPYSEWSANPPAYGAYEGGYADSTSTRGKSHIPGLSCTMEARQHFCDICKQGIEDVVAFGAGSAL